MKKKNFLAYTLLAFGVLIFIYTFYKSEIYFDGLNRKFYKIYFYTSLTFIFLSLVSFYISEKIRTYFSIIFLSFIFSIYIFEIYQNIYLINYKSFIYEKKTGKKFDKRSKYEIFSDLKKRNSDVVVFNNINNSDLITFSGVSNSETINCNENGYFSIYNSDDYGFNNPKYNLEEDEFEYVLLGDSYVHGACVNRPFDIASVLRTISNKNSLNLGVRGTGPLRQYAIIKEYLPKKFKNLVWFYFVNDNEDLIRELKNNFLVNYLNDDNFFQNLKIKQQSIDLLNLKEINKKFLDKTPPTKIDFKNILKLYKTRDLLLNKKKVAQGKVEIPEEYFLIMKKINKIAELNDANFFLVLLPSYSQIKHDKIIDNNLVKFKRRLKSEKINVIDIKKMIFDKKQNPLKLFPFEKPGHYTKEGYAHIGKLIYHLTKNE